VAPPPLPAVTIPPAISTSEATTTVTKISAPLAYEVPDRGGPGSTDTRANRLSPPQNASVLTVANDSLWTISERAYGNGLFYQALFALNRDRVLRPDRIAPGIEILTPPLAELRQRFPNLCPDMRN
jgi:nucleoid-associated protein YgaU